MLEVVTQDDVRGADAGARHAQDDVRGVFLVRAILNKPLQQIQLASLVYRYRHCFS